MAKATNPVPPNFHTLSPHLIVKDAAKYGDFLVKAFGATDVSANLGPTGKVMHAQARIGDSMLMFADHMPEFGHPPIAGGFWPMILHVYVPDVDAVWAKALAAGCTVKFPIDDQFWGDRYGQVQDPFGFTWSLATHKEELTSEEIQARQAKAFSGGGAA